MLKQSEIKYTAGCRIIFPSNHLQTLIEHCRRKLDENYMPGEVRERKGFGLIGGSQHDDTITVKTCLPLLKNARNLEPYKQFMDDAMTRYAMVSETPFSKRGWIADPQELMKNVKKIQQGNMLLLGTYHMHRVAWPDDPLRDTPTRLDTILAADSRMLLFVVSMVNPDRPIIRAFYEGRPDREIPIITKDFSK